MKKALIFTIIFIVFILTYFLQINFFSWFRIAGVMPNLFIIFILILGLFTGRAVGVTCGIVVRYITGFLYREKYRNISNNVWNCRFYGRVFRKKFFKR